MPQTLPPSWDLARLTSDAAAAIEFFREERMTEPLEVYSDHFQTARATMENLLESTVVLADPKKRALDLLTDPETLGVLQYLAGPPISRDDLETVGELRLSAAAL